MDDKSVFERLKAIESNRDVSLFDCEDPTIESVLSNCSSENPKERKLVVQFWTQLFELLEDRVTFEENLVEVFVDWLSQNQTLLLKPLKKSLRTQLEAGRGLQDLPVMKGSGNIDWDAISIGGAKCSSELSVPGYCSLDFIVSLVANSSRKRLKNSLHVLNSLFIDLTLISKSESCASIAEKFVKADLLTSLLRAIVGSDISALDREALETEISNAAGLEQILFWLLGLTNKDIMIDQKSLSKKQLFLMASTFSNLPSLDVDNFSSFIDKLIGSESNASRSVRLLFNNISVKLFADAPFIYFLGKLDCLNCHQKMVLLKKFCLKSSFKLAGENFSSLTCSVECSHSLKSIDEVLRQVSSFASKKIAQKFDQIYFQYPFVYTKYFQVPDNYPALFDKERLDIWCDLFVNPENDVQCLVEKLSPQVLTWILNCNRDEKFVKTLFDSLKPGDKTLSENFVLVLPYFSRLVSPQILLEFLINTFANCSMFLLPSIMTWDLFSFVNKFFKGAPAYSVTVDSEAVERLIKSLLVKPRLWIQFDWELRPDLCVLNVALSNLYLTESMAFKTMDLITDLDSLRNTQLLLLCHLMQQFPKLSLKLNLSELMKRYTCSLNLVDQMLKKLIHTWQVDGIVGEDVKFRIERRRMMFTIDSWYHICSFVKSELTSEKFLEFSIGKKVVSFDLVYDPEFALALVNKDLQEHDGVNNGLPLLNIEGFLISGKLGFLIMCLSEHTPESYATVAKMLLSKFAMIVKLWKHAFKGLVEKSLEILKNSLKSKDAALPHCVAMFFAQLVSSLFDQDSGYLKKDESSGSTKKFKRQKAIEAWNKKASESDLIKFLRNFVLGSETGVIDSSNFPSKSVVSAISCANEVTAKTSEWIVDVLCKGAVGPDSFQMLSSSGAMWKILDVTTCKITSNKQVIFSFAYFIGNLAKFRNVLKMAINDFHLDKIIIQVMENNPANESITAAVRTFIEKTILDDQNRFYPLQDILTPARSLFYMEKYMGSMSSSCFKTGLSTRVVAVVIGLMLKCDAETIRKTDNSFMAHFFEKICNSDSAKNSTKLFTYLKWTHSLIVSNDTCSQQKLYFVQKVENLLRKIHL